MSIEQAAKLAVFALQACLLVFVSIQVGAYVKAYRQATSWRARLSVFKTRSLGLCIWILLAIVVARLSWHAIGLRPFS